MMRHFFGKVVIEIIVQVFNYRKRLSIFFTLLSAIIGRFY